MPRSPVTTPSRVQEHRSCSGQRTFWSGLVCPPRRAAVSGNSDAHLVLWSGHGLDLSPVLAFGSRLLVRMVRKLPWVVFGHVLHLMFSPLSFILMFFLCRLVLLLGFTVWLLGSLFDYLVHCLVIWFRCLVSPFGFPRLVFPIFLSSFFPDYCTIISKLPLAGGGSLK